MESPDKSKWNQDGSPAKSGRNGPSVALIVALVVAGIVLIWFLQNGDNVEITFLFGEWHTSLRWAILIAIVFGVLLDRLVMYAMKRRKRRKVDDD